MSRTHSPLALGQSGLSTTACRLSLFPCPVGAPVPPPHWVLALGPAVKRVAPTPPRVPRPPSPCFGCSLVLLCQPVLHQIGQQRLPLLRKPERVLLSWWNPSIIIPPRRQRHQAIWTGTRSALENGIIILPHFHFYRLKTLITLNIDDKTLGQIRQTQSTRTLTAIFLPSRIILKEKPEGVCTQARILNT